MNARAKGLVLGLGLAAVLGLLSCGGGGDGSRFTDERDNQTYRTVRIGNLTWMAENLNYQTENSWCYDDDNSNCEKYGRLYTWNAAMLSCPAEWRLPNDADWDDLMTAVGASAGTKLRSRTGWNTNGDYIPGTDAFGFSALPGGHRWAGDFDRVGLSGNWWSATEGDATRARRRNISYNGSNVHTNWNNKDFAISVRCVSD